MNAQERPENDSNLLSLAELEVLHRQEVKAKTVLQVARMFKVCPTQRELFIGWENYWFKTFKEFLFNQQLARQKLSAATHDFKKLVQESH